MTGTVAALWARGDLDACFGAAPKVVVPWPSVGRRKGETVPRDEIASAVDSPARLIEVDPRVLHATQTWVLRTHADYYMTGEWEITGRTSADMHSAANRYPTLIERHGRLVILTGHHRSLVALIEGRPVLARVVGVESAGPVALTPHLTITHGGPAFLGAVPLANGLRAGAKVGVGDIATAVEILRWVGLDDAEIADRLRRAGCA